jgi:hypothetical protein
LAAPPEDGIELSLNEVETLALKAARGAGLPWGVAEDVGRSAAWLARCVGTWAESLLMLLENPPAAARSPLLLAGALADGAVATAELVVAPLWVLPPLLLGPGRCNPVALRLGMEEIRCNPGEAPGATCSAAGLAALPPSLVAVRLHPQRLPPLPNAMPQHLRRSIVTRGALARLEALAALTYVPASEASRRRGAGAGLLDDD